MVSAKDLREKTIKQLEKQKRETKEKLAKLKIDVIQEKETNLQKIRELKKDYAKILTVINEKRREKNA